MSFIYFLRNRAGFSFARGHFVVQVPYDQYEPMVFQGEEIFMGLRGWSYGYDYYTAEISVAFHMYAIKENKDKRKKVKLFWENSNLYPGAAVQGMKRLNGIIGLGDPGDVFYNAEEKEYGLGKVRKKEQFYHLYGIHTDTKKVEDNLCQFVGKPMQKLFKPHLRKNRMGIDFSDVDFAYKDSHASAITSKK
jgi:[Skp1-protein]-hydroxyproline N-acetylglucosaminyltransferase